jgi:hypothetical protein
MTKRTMMQEAVLSAIDQMRRDANSQLSGEQWEELKRQMGVDMASGADRSAIAIHKGNQAANPYQTVGGLGQAPLAQDHFAKQAAAQGYAPRRRITKGGWGDNLWDEFNQVLKKREAIVPMDIAAKLPPAPEVETKPEEGEPGSGHGVRVADQYGAIAARMKELEAEKQTRLG